MLSAQRAIYLLAIFLSAALVFSVQPIIAKLVLPRLGGSPSVWTVAMLFFQTVLLAGYFYAHLLARGLTPRAQALLHGAVLIAGALFLPFALPADWAPDPQAPVTVQALGLFALLVAVPFFALSANAPLLQHWYARTGQPDAADPYFLYGASNVGSIAALLAYPLVLEPFLGTGTISWIWTAGYGVFGLTLIGCAAGVFPVTAPLPRPEKSQTRPAQIAFWIGLAVVPSGLMLATTQILATDIGSFPLLWAIPLALYLLSFVVTFGKRSWLPEPIIQMIFVITLILAIIALAQGQLARLGWGGFGLMLVLFFSGALVFHRRLYQARPAAGALTAFYFSMSVGGALGGVFNAIAAPLLFDQALEAPLLLVAAGLGLLGTWMPLRNLGLACAAAAVILIIDPTVRGDIAAFAVAAVLFLSYRSPLQFSAFAAIILVAGYTAQQQDVVHRARSFFGIYKVQDRPEQGVRNLAHGTTIHGQQYIQDLGKRPRSLGYYDEAGPIAEILKAAGPDAHIGIVGLGVGALSCYAQPGQTWTFYEIDAEIDRIARDTDLFNHMQICGTSMPTILGDARIALQEDPRSFDVLMIDAFTSDAIPTHLLTLEAMELYRARLREGGRLMIHISNRFADLAPIIGLAGQHLGMPAWIRRFAPGPGDSKDAKPTSVTVIGAAQPGPDWVPLTPADRAPWTDDFASVLGVMRFLQRGD